MVLFHRIFTHISASGVEPGDSLSWWRVKIFTAFILPAQILALAAILSALFVAFRHHNWNVFFITLTVYLISLAAVFTKKIHFNIRFIILLSIFYIIGVYVTLFIGPLSGGPVWLFSFSIFTAILMGTRASIISVTLNSATIIVIALLFYNKIIGTTLPFFTSLETMLSGLMNFFLLNVTTSVSISVLVKSLISMHKKEESLKNRLQRAERMEALGHLAGGVAHDLNNILSGIVTYPDMLLYKLPDDDPMKSPLKTIKYSGIRAAAVVQDLLSLARRHVPSPEIINLNIVLEDYLNSPEHQRLVEEKDTIVIDMHFGNDLKNISGSPVHISKTIMNLVINAAEAINDVGTIYITTETCIIDKPLQVYETIPPGEYSLLLVKDSGSGIQLNDLEHIFEPFYTRKKLGRSGTGLGLSVVWGTIRDHEGYIDVSSSSGGTIFTLYFPVTEEEVVKRKEIVPIESLKGKGEHILVVDDIPDQLKIASDLLLTLGYSPLTAGSGEEALKMVQQEKPALVILDMIMPGGMDGLETYRKILKIYPDLKALIASGYAETDRIQRAIKPGLSAFLLKPYSLSALGEALAFLLKEPLFKEP